MNRNNTEYSLEYFREHAAAWDTQPRHVELAAAIAGAIKQRIPLADIRHALEYGCGTGLISLLLADCLEQITASDISPEMIDQLNRKIAVNKILNVQTQIIDLIAEPPAKAKYDLIICAMALHHMDHVDKVLSALYLLLKPAGYLALADLDREDGSFHDHRPGIAHFGFDRNELTDTLTVIGFNQAHIETVHTIVKPGTDNTDGEYPVFFLTTQKSG